MEKTPRIYVSYCFILCVLFLTAGCMRTVVRLDLDTYLQQQDSYKGKDIVITATFDDVLARYSLYKDKTIEVAAPVAWYKSYGFWTWHMLLTENGKTLRCYTPHYRIEPGWDAVNLLDRAIHNKRPVTVLGILRKDGLDIQRLTCDGESATTNYKPIRPASGWWMMY